MKLPLPDLIVFLVYMAGIVLFGSSFYRKNKNSGQFTSGGGKLPAWIVGMSIFATFVSSISFLALPGKAYQSDWNAFVFSLSNMFHGRVSYPRHEDQGDQPPKPHACGQRSSRSPRAVPDSASGATQPRPAAA